MAHSTFHFAAGLAIGTAAYLPAFWKRCVSGAHLAAFFARWMGTAYLLGLFAVCPGLLRHTSLPAWLIDGWWMNIFVFYPIIERIEKSGYVRGAAGIAACSALFYLLILIALNRQLRARGLPGHHTDRCCITDGT